MKEGYIKNQSGQSILEVLVALAILAVSISSAMFLIFQSQSFSIDSVVNQEATHLAQNGLEESRKTAKANFDSLASTSTLVGDFLQEIIVESVDDYSKKIISRATWQADIRRPQKVELTTVVTDWQNAAPPPDTGDTGGSGLSGDWRNPRTLGSVDLGPGNSATDIDVVNKIIYLSAEASAAAKPDFFIIDATDGQSPATVSSLNTGSGLNALDVSGNYAYVANRSTSAQLQVIDVSDRNNPVLAQSFQLPGVSGSGAVGNAIFYGYSKIFIGAKKASGPEFHIIDVTNPLNPSALGSFEINADINDIYIQGDLVYLATSEKELVILDVSSPANIVKIGEYDASGDDDSRCVQAVDKKLYLGTRKMNILSIASSSAPQLLGLKDLSDNVNDLRIRDELVFLGTSDSNNEFQIYNIADPSNIVFWSSFNFPQVASGIDYEDNIVYVAVRSNNALRIITSSP